MFQVEVFPEETIFSPESASRHRTVAPITGPLLDAERLTIIRQLAVPGTRVRVIRYCQDATLEHVEQARDWSARCAAIENYTTWPIALRSMDHLHAVFRRSCAITIGIGAERMAQNCKPVAMA